MLPRCPASEILIDEVLPVLLVVNATSLFLGLYMLPPLVNVIDDEAAIVYIFRVVWECLLVCFFRTR